tara:strand:- start:257 stop:868 length:612 start_codon:yes stop_codon:yes gene_type:complete
MTNRRNCYEILGLERGSGIDSIRRAYRRLSTLFEPGNVTLCGLYDEADLRALLGEVRHAYRVLMDPAARREHDAYLFPPGMTVDMSVDYPVDDFPMTDEADDFDAGSAKLGFGSEPTSPGRVLKQARIKMGMSLEEIEERTKIAIFTLRCIEDEAYSDLPPMVYLKGFLQQVGRLLRLESPAVLDEYIERYAAFCKQREDGFA